MTIRTRWDKAIVSRFIEEIWNQRKVEIAPEIFTDDFEAHVLNYGYSPRKGVQSRGPGHVKPLVDYWYSALSEHHEEILHICGEGDRVAVAEILHGIHTGDFFTARGERFPPTGKKVTMAGMRIFRMEKRKIAEFWALWDLEGLRKQLGAPSG